MFRLFGGFRHRIRAAEGNEDGELGVIAPPPPPPETTDLPGYLQGFRWNTATVPTINPALIVEAGDLDVSGAFLAASGSDVAGSAAWFSATSSEGEMSLSWVAVGSIAQPTTAGIWVLKCRGVEVLRANTIFPTRTVMTWRANDLIVWRVWYRPSTGACGIRVIVNGVSLPDTTTATSGSALVAPTTVTTISPAIASTTPQYQRFIARQAAQVPVALTPEFIVLGDSTSAPFWWQSSTTGIYSNLISIVHDTYAVGATWETSERFLRAGILLLGVPGDTTSGQQAKFSASPQSSQANVVAVIIMVGINDRGPATAGAADFVVTNYTQPLVNTIRAARPTAKILAAKLVPFTAGNPAEAAFLDEFNANVMGTGAVPLTGADGQITAHYPTLDDGLGAYKPQYNFDNLHENNPGRSVVAQAFRAALQTAGVL